MKIYNKYILFLIFSCITSSYAAQNSIKQTSIIAESIEKLTELVGDHHWPQRREIIRKAINTGIHPDALHSDKNWDSSPLADAILQDDYIFTLLLLKRRANPNQLWHREPIILIAGTSPLVQALIDYKADIHINAGHSGNSLLHHCLPFTDDPEIILTYCEAGVDPCEKNHDGENPLFYALSPLYGHLVTKRATKLRLLTLVGTPFDTKTYKGATLTQIIQKNIDDNPSERNEHIRSLTIIATATKERKTHITKSLGRSLPGAHQGSAHSHGELIQTILEYDGQTTDLTL